MMDLFVSKSGSLRSTLLLLVGLLFLVPTDANAQRWLQTSQLLVPVEDGPTRALLDTLVQVVERKDSVLIRRTADEKGGMGISQLRDKLINEQGIGLSSASHVFVDYRFEIRNRGFEESITSLQFVYRQGQGMEDIQMMYIDASKTWIRDILRNKGTSLRTNEAALKPFADQLAFARMHQKGKIVEIAGETVREGFQRKKRQLVQKITRLTYESM